MLLIVYNKKTCKEIMLPRVFNSDFSVYLDKDEYSLNDSLLLKFENNSDNWILHNSQGYSIKYHHNYETNHILKEEDLIVINTEHGDSLFLLVAIKTRSFQLLEKYDISRHTKITVGKNDENTIVYDFMKLISSFHATLVKSSTGWTLIDQSSNGIFKNHRRLPKQRQLKFGDHLEMFGLHIIFMGSALLVGSTCGKLRVSSALSKIAIPPIEEHDDLFEEDTVVYFNRSPRKIPFIYTNEIKIEDPPAPKVQKDKPTYMVIGPAFSMAIPMTLGMLLAARGGAFMLTGLITAIGSAIIGAFWAYANMRYSKKEIVEDEKQRFNAYSNYLIEVANAIRSQYMHNTAALNQINPSIEHILRFNFKSAELWTRSMTHSDFLNVRIGSGQQPFQVPVTVSQKKFSLVNDSLIDKPAEIANSFRMLQNVPVTVDLMQHRLIGLVGGPHKFGGLDMMHTLTAQIAAFHTYTDVKLVYLFDESDRNYLNAWECMRWFPHTWSENHSTRFLAGNSIERRDVLFELTNVIRNRAEEASQIGQKKVIPRPHYVIFVSDPSLIEGEMIQRYIYNALPEYGITTILMVEEVSQLPNECTYIIQNTGNARSIYSTMTQASGYQYFVPDIIKESQIERYGVTLANIKIRETETTSEIPDRLSFLEMYNVNDVRDLNVADRWRKNRTFQSMRALIGRKAGNADCYLDIHEKFHGPHGLIAGTTGSGKSETLQTYILSLAVNFSPEDVSFFIIDFKGGGMANLFEDMPHLAGHISNLSGNQIQRAMISITSENTRRQRIFAEYGVQHINQYTELYKYHETNIPISHLFIIIDEFAELKREHPEFMAKLISVATIGRSLGVHLILSTQKPSGTVDESIWSNTRFKLCLRVQDRQDSMDMLHKPDAAFLTQAGRCYLQVGNDEIYELFQSGYSGAIYSSKRKESDDIALINRNGKAYVFPTVSNTESKNTKIRQKTELEAVVEHLRVISESQHYQKSAQLWLPVLGKSILWNTLVAPNSYFNGRQWPDPAGDLEATVGLYDDPHNQVQAPLNVNITESGHLAVLGGAVTGKSTFIQTLVYGLMMKYSPKVLNMYLLDYSSHKLVSFEKAPHVGGVVTDENEDRIDKFFTMITAIMEERKNLLKGGSFTEYILANGRVLPAILVALDNFESFREKTDDRYIDLVQQLAREGISRGIYLVVSASGFGISAIPTRISDNIKTTITLEQQDKFKYMEVLHISKLELLPESNIRGRGLASVNDRVLEFQTALPVEAPDDFNRGEKLKEISETMADAWHGPTARKIPEIPAEPTLELIEQDERYMQQIADRNMLPFAYRKEDASICSFDLRHNYCSVILGRKRTGKTNVLKLLIHAAMLKKGEIIVVEKPEGYGELKAICEAAGGRYVDSTAALYKYFGELLPEFARRNKIKRSLLEKGLDELSIAEEMMKEKQIFIFIADMKQFMEMIYHHEIEVGNMSGFFENISEKGSLHNIYMFASENQDDHAGLMAYKAYNNFVSAKKGVYTGGTLTNQKIFNFQNIPYAELSKPLKKGVGYISDDYEEAAGNQIVIPLVRMKV